MRDIRNKISLETKNMNLEELRDYFGKQKPSITAEPKEKYRKK